MMGTKLLGLAGILLLAVSPLTAISSHGLHAHVKSAKPSPWPAQVSTQLRIARQWAGGQFSFLLTAILHFYRHRGEELHGAVLGQSDGAYGGQDLIAASLVRYILKYDHSAPLRPLTQIKTLRRSASFIKQTRAVLMSGTSLVLGPFTYADAAAAEPLLRRYNALALVPLERPDGLPEGSPLVFVYPSQDQLLSLALHYSRFLGVKTALFILPSGTPGWEQWPTSHPHPKNKITARKVNWLKRSDIRYAFIHLPKKKQVLASWQVEQIVRSAPEAIIYLLPAFAAEKSIHDQLAFWEAHRFKELYALRPDDLDKFAQFAPTLQETYVMGDFLANKEFASLALQTITLDKNRVSPERDYLRLLSASEIYATLLTEHHFQQVSRARSPVQPFRLHLLNGDFKTVLGPRTKVQGRSEKLYRFYKGSFWETATIENGTVTALRAAKTFACFSLVMRHVQACPYYSVKTS